MFEREGRVSHIRRAVYALRDGGDFGAHRVVVRVSVIHAVVFEGAHLSHLSGECASAFAALCEAFRQHRFRAAFAAERSESVKLRVRVGGKSVYRHNNPASEPFQVVEMTFYVTEPAFQRFDVFFRGVFLRHSAIEFEASRRDDEHYAVG